MRLVLYTEAGRAFAGTVIDSDGPISAATTGMPRDAALRWLLDHPEAGVSVEEFDAPTGAIAAPAEGRA